MERCAACGRQAISCGCFEEEPYELDDEADIDALVASSPWLRPFAAAVAPARRAHREVLAELAGWALARGHSVDLDCAAVVLDSLDDQLGPAPHRRPLGRVDVLDVLRTRVHGWASERRTVFPQRLPEDAWSVVVHLAETGRLPPGSDPLHALLQPIDCYANIGPDGHRRAFRRPWWFDCRCDEPYDPSEEETAVPRGP
jgi:hypothetical protein